MTKTAEIFWARRAEIQSLLSTLSQIKNNLERNKNLDDPLYRVVSNAALADLSRAYQHISDAKPYTLCTTCEGYPETQQGGCGFCGSTGLISKKRWNLVDDQIKRLRKK